MFEDPGAPAIRLTNFDWSDFEEWDNNICEKFVNNPNHSYVPEFVNITTSRDRMKLYFSKKPVEKALLRLALGGATEKELQVGALLYDTTMLVMPSPF